MSRNPTGECKYCGKEFEKVRKWKEFCSPKCKNNWHNERRNRAMSMLEKHEEGEDNKDG